MKGKIKRWCWNQGKDKIKGNGPNYKLFIYFMNFVIYLLVDRHTLHIIYKFCRVVFLFTMQWCPQKARLWLTTNPAHPLHLVVRCCCGAAAAVTCALSCAHNLMVVLGETFNFIITGFPLNIFICVCSYKCVCNVYCGLKNPKIL